MILNNKNDRLKFPQPPFSAACKALWGDDIIRLLALAAWTQQKLKTISFA